VTLTILGAVAEFERAKIIERMIRGKHHRLRKGEMIGGQLPFGYSYVKKTQSTPATLAINEPQASIVRQLFEMYAHGASLNTLTRWLEQNEISVIIVGERTCA
jgi:site-specific DNA recombinase